MTDQESLVEIDNELAKLNQAIKSAESKKKEILKKLSNSNLPFEKEFAYWHHNSQKTIYPYLPGAKDFPHLHKFLKKHGWASERHEIEDFINDDGTLACIMWEVANLEKCREGVEDMRNEYFDSQEECFAVLKEVMEANMGGYKYDW